MQTSFSRLKMATSMSAERILSAPVDVFWGPWRTTTTALQQAGWELAVEHDFAHWGYRMVIHHRQMQMWGMSDVVEMSRGYEARYGQNLHPIYIKYMASKLNINIMAPLMAFKPIDAYPQISHQEIKSIEDMVQFATPLVRTKELIVNPDEIGKILELIQQAQLPEQETIRRRERLKASREGCTIDSIPQQVFHAQVLSIAA